MISIKSAFVATLLYFTFAQGTDVYKCRDSKRPKLKDDEVTVSACSGPPCVLKKNTEPSITIILKPEKDITELKTLASAYIGGVPLPFLGVDGTSACPKIYSEDGKTQVGCPLKAGGTYQYKNSFKILELYPKLSVVIHWALADSTTREHVICFELPARIS